VCPVDYVFRVAVWRRRVPLGGAGWEGDKSSSSIDGIKSSRLKIFMGCLDVFFEVTDAFDLTHRFKY
jgi:hypothetical protein